MLGTCRVGIRLGIGGGTVIAMAAFALAITSGCARRHTGELAPPSGAPDWESRFGVAFDDDYTREQLNLQGRAPHDVLDQRLFAARLGHAAIVALVTVEQVWGKGRYQGKQDQFLTVTIGKVLLGEMPKHTDPEQMLVVRGEDELPGELQGRSMVMFVRWAPGATPAFHHHLMPADEQIVTFIDAMVRHAQDEGVLDESRRERKRPRRRRKRRKPKAKAKAEATASSSAQ